MNTSEPASPRRRFRLQFSLLALLVFMTAACLVLYWLSRSRPVNVVALLTVDSRLAVTPPRMDGSRDTIAAIDGRRQWEIVQRTQLAYLKSRAVLQAAVGDPQIAKLPLVSRQVDPIGWLQQRLEPQFQQNSEILSVRLAVREKDASDAQALLGAIVTAYLQTVSADEQRQWRSELQNRQADLDVLRAAIEDQSRAIAELRAERGPADSEARLLQIEADRKVDAVCMLKAEIEFVNFQLNSPPRVRPIQLPVVAK
jgi:hypothetical protein